MEEWRSDPGRRAVAAAWLEEQVEGLRITTAFAEGAVQYLPPPITETNGLTHMIMRATELQRRAARDLREVLELAEDDLDNETFIGNLAVHGVGMLPVKEEHT